MAYKYDNNKVAKIKMNANMLISERYSLEIDLKNKGKESILIIMQNPSRANYKVSDKTINNLIEIFFPNKTVSKLYIMNLFVKYGTKPSSVTGAYYDLIGMTKFDIDEYFNRLALKADKVVVAWGGIPQKGTLKEWHVMRSSEVLSIVMERNYPIYCFGKTKTGFPLHPRNLSTATLKYYTC
ncbi:hypothetical protein CI105_08610 [Candidatus Izimaplasma bacterium ZiA1]|uniref:DUF1643 domain-containing protein n=1 Tax=Candidatus Izimoplasma sp. ZiA1 TaxID=2024899 RepID=UPI000BAA75AA|nr:hypothetical protein CI105_08610 [Candidatus Izimaplasma bacterium ZiA1]